MRFTSKPIKGLGQGKAIGYPTINLAIPHEFSLPFGVYGCAVLMKRQRFTGILYFGPRTMVDKKVITLEVHLIKTDAGTTATNTPVTVEIGTFIRSPRFFRKVSALQKQIQTDLEKLTIKMGVKSE
jgi:riboflavin kinase/FMN adenylyltransferase